MIIDKIGMFSEAQVDWYNAGSYLSAKSVDLGVTKGVQGIKLPYFYAKTGSAAFATGTSVEFQLVCADDEALTSNLVVLLSSGAIATASLTANKVVFSGKLPDDIPKRYLGMRYVSVESSDFTAGAITSGLTDRVPTGAF